MKYFLTISFFVLSGISLAQKPNDDVNLKKFHPEYLELLLEKGINDYRVKNNVPSLQKDDVLHVAAADQSEYILKSEKVTHTQTLKKKATPFDRVVFYDGMHGKVAENCQQIALGTKVKTTGQKNSSLIKSYEDVANYIIQEWINAKGGSEIILNRDYYRIATALAIDPKKKLIIATQLYASEPFELPEGIKPEKDDYKIEPYNKSKCAELYSKYSYLPELMSDNIFFRDGQIYFYFHDLELLKGVLKDANDGIALDIISRDQFGCGHGNKFYPSSIHSGIMLPPISKSQIFSKNELKKDNQIEVSLGLIPDFVDTNNVEFNLLMIKDNCLCQTIIYNSLGGENIHSLDLNFLMDTLSISNQADSVMNQLTFTIPFERNKSQYSSEDIKPFLDSLSLNRYDLKKIEVIAYSSIEGGVEGNKIIQQKRAKSILAAIQKYKLQDVETAVSTQENFDGFYESIKGSPYEEKLKKLSKEELRKIVNSDTLEYNLEPYLEGQRKAKIILTVEKIFMDTALFKVLPKRFDEAIKKKDYTKAKIYQSFMLNNIGNGKISKDEIIKMKIPHLLKTVPLINNQIAFRWFYSNAENRDSLHKYLLRDIETQLRIDPENSYLLYNKIVLRLLLWANKYERESDPKNLLKDIKLLYNSTKIEQWMINRLILNYNIISADFYYDTKKFKERDKALDEVRKILLSSKLDRNQTYIIANYFIFQMRINWAIDIMKPFAEKKNIDEEFLFTFLTIAIYNKEKVPEPEYINFMSRAKEMNQERFCKQFGYPNMSFQLLKDVQVKDMYCKTCNQK